MATQHAAPTEVRIAAVEEPSALQAFIKSQGKWLFLLLAGTIAFILVRESMRSESEGDALSSWARVGQDVTMPVGFSASLDAPSAASLDALARDPAVAGQAAAPWVRLIQARATADEGADPSSAADMLREEAPDHPLATIPLRLAPGEDPALPGDIILFRGERMQAWRDGHADLFQNPAPPENGPRVRIETSKGPLVVALYPDRAPEHVANFLALTEDGSYVGTRFHRVIPGFMVQGGDPNSRDGAPETWGQGGTDRTLAPEESGLRHFRLALASAKQSGATEENGSQFYITTGPAHHLDGQHTVFGVLVEGEAVLEQIESGPTVGDRPQDPVAIEAITAL